MNSSLSVEEKSVAAVSAAAARGNYTALKTALTQGLDAGVDVNTFKEILVQLYAYGGFPASLNSLETLRTLVNERGNTDKTGKESASKGIIPLPGSKSYPSGINVAEIMKL